MLGLGWGEMLVIGVIALIVIGPKDLPVVMHNVGKVIGQIRRMGSEFQRELNKTTGLDEVRNLRRSITEPLRQTSDEIRREFNKMTPNGVQPSGALKPAKPGSESVVEEIRAAAGMPPSSAESAPQGESAEAQAVTSADGPQNDPSPSGPVKAKPTSTRPAITNQTDTGTKPDGAPAKATRKATAKKTSSALLTDAEKATKARRKVPPNDDSSDTAAESGSGLPPPPPKAARKPRASRKNAPVDAAPSDTTRTETE